MSTKATSIAGGKADSDAVGAEVTAKTHSNK